MKKYILMLLMVTVSNANAAGVSLIEVFTTNGGAIKELSEQINRSRSYKLVIHNMNRVEEWEKEFSEGLPGDEESAKVEVDRRIEKMGGRQVFGDEVLRAYEPLMRATEIGLMEFPAVVIDENYVVYGTDSVDLAIERYWTWKKSKEQ